MQQLTLAIITDIHHGPDRGTKLGTTALPLLAKFRDFISDLRPACTVEIGDRISEVDEETDRILVSEVASALAKIPGPIHHVMGNHDIATLTVADNENLMQRSFASYSIDMNGFHLVFWNANVKLDYANGFCLPSEDLDWLRRDLAATELPCIIFTHVPLDNGSMKGNFYFERKFAHLGNYPEAQGKAIRDVIERSGKVILCLNGHAHWNAYHGIDGTHYVTIPSLTESFMTWPYPSESFACVRIANAIEIEIFGKEPFFYRLPIKTHHKHWLNLDKAYAPVTVQPA